MKVDIKSGSHEVRAADANNFSSNAISEAALILPNRPRPSNLWRGLGGSRRRFALPICNSGSGAKRGRHRAMANAAASRNSLF
ncbi:MAG: hypothetical protein LC098_13400 [Burkholderiales bacterium]|nr:hypothetical protein [Burkholderiales bacterium]